MERARTFAVAVASREPRQRGCIAASLTLHSALALTLVVGQLFVADTMPVRDLSDSIFRPPLQITASLALPPPPPAPISRVSAQGGRMRDTQGGNLITPIDIPSEIPLVSELDLGPRSPDGLPGGVFDGIQSGVGVVSPTAPPITPPAPPERRVRISHLRAPRLIHKVEPAYPPPAEAAGVSAIVILEAEVDARGEVTATRILRGHPLFDTAAMEAVQQWRYQPLLLSGEPTGFILTVTVNFRLPRR